jgi:hypothetical protein
MKEKTEVKNFFDGCIFLAHVNYSKQTFILYFYFEDFILADDHYLLS